MSIKLKPMLPTLSEKIPEGKEWVYEVKYDGFRCILYYSGTKMELISRNLRLLNSSFPEIMLTIEQSSNKLNEFAPFIIDGELASLTSSHRANFEHIQIRGRTKIESKINQLMQAYPIQFLGFDLLQVKGKDITNEAYEVRKEKLYDLITSCHFAPHVAQSYAGNIQYVPFVESKDSIWEEVLDHQGEGIIAKKRKSVWKPGVRTEQWLKIKNWQYEIFFIIGYEKKNGYFHVGLMQEDRIKDVGLFIHGMSTEEKEALFKIIKLNKQNETEEFITVKPSICVELRFIEWYKTQIRHPQFVKFRFDYDWRECKWDIVNTPVK